MGPQRGAAAAGTGLGLVESWNPSSQGQVYRSGAWGVQSTAELCRDCCVRGWHSCKTKPDQTSSNAWGLLSPPPYPPRRHGTGAWLWLCLSGLLSRGGPNSAPMSPAAQEQPPRPAAAFPWLPRGALQQGRSGVDSPTLRAANGRLRTPGRTGWGNVAPGPVEGGSRLSLELPQPGFWGASWPLEPTHSTAVGCGPAQRLH